ncbi:MAG: hydrolase [Desulfobacteraceae bacterium]|nr:hydrolase [Desulfobacteraceae bacterium]
MDYTIQLGAFSTTTAAARYAQRLMESGLDAYYFIDTDKLSKVRFGRFNTKSAAHIHALDLQDRGIIEVFYIVRPSSGARRRPVDPIRILRTDLVTTAHRFIGTPYQWGGTSANRGFDCSGLTMTVYRLNGLDLPRNSAAQFAAGTPLSRNSLEPGDLVFFATTGRGRVSHVGIYTGEGRFIHAPGRGKTIRTASLSSSYFKSRYKGARRYL